MKPKTTIYHVDFKNKIVVCIENINNVTNVVQIVDTDESEKSSTEGKEQQCQTKNS